MTPYLIGLGIGSLFGWFWGYAAGQRSVVILPAQSTPLSGAGTEGQEGQ